MNTNKNTYTVVYATILVLLVAAILSIVSVSLKTRQQRNVDTETKQSILSSVNLAAGADEAADKGKFIEEQYAKYITESYLVNANGDKVEGDAFKLSLKSQYDIMKVSNPDASRLTLPVFVCTTDNGEKIQIFPVYGAGLWGPIWGYLSLKDDFNTVCGAVFDHKGETPGLGAEIATERFRNQFAGKQIFDGNTLTSISVVKGGAEEGDVHGVDAISGGTITSTSLQTTIRMWLEYYKPYITKQIAAKTVNTVEEEVK